MGPSGPARDYYQACLGEWRAPIEVRITDEAALVAAGMSWADRMSLKILERWPSWLGELSLDTSVAFRGEGQVLHETIVRWMGVPLKKSVEVFTFDADGERFSVEGGMTGSGWVEEGATKAHYRLRWLGVDIEQRTVRETDQVTINQEGPGFRAFQTLIRQSH